MSRCVAQGAGFLVLALRKEPTSRARLLPVPIVTPLESKEVALANTFLQPQHDKPSSTISWLSVPKAHGTGELTKSNETAPYHHSGTLDVSQSSVLLFLEHYLTWYVLRLLEALLLTSQHLPWLDLGSLLSAHWQDAAVAWLVRTFLFGSLILHKFFVSTWYAV